MRTQKSQGKRYLERDTIYQINTFGKEIGLVGCSDNPLLFHSLAVHPLLNKATVAVTDRQFGAGL
jgi:hypothetical protein